MGSNSQKWYHQNTVILDKLPKCLLIVVTTIAAEHGWHTVRFDPVIMPVSVRFGKFTTRIGTNKNREKTDQ